jgi:hypothetical protein
VTVRNLTFTSEDEYHDSELEFSYRYRFDYSQGITTGGTVKIRREIEKGDGTTEDESVPPPYVHKDALIGFMAQLARAERSSQALALGDLQALGL